MSRWVLLVLAATVAAVSSQRLSQGASDWYMRFHTNFDFVKRNVERPVTKSFVVSSTVEHRYAITEVRSVIFNPATTVSQVYNFGFVIPRTAFVSRVTLYRVSSDGSKMDVVTSRLNESEWMMQRLPQADDGDEEEAMESRRGANGSANGHVSADVIASADANANLVSDANGSAGINSANPKAKFNGNANPNPNGSLHSSEVEEDPSWDLIHGDRVNFKQFILPIHLKPSDEVTITLVYEYAVERNNFKYRHTVSAYPGEIVKDFQLRLTVIEDRPIVGLKVQIPVLGEISGDAIEIEGNQVKIAFNMSEVEQFDYFGNHGFAGDIKLDYDVDVSGGTQLVTKDGYFAHFYHGPPAVTEMKGIPMHVLILIDVGESMGGPKIKHAKELAKLHLELLDQNFFINLIVFNEVITEWRPEGITAEDDAFKCNAETLASALNFIESLEAHSKNVSDLTGAVLRAIDLDKKVWSSGLMPDNALTTIVLITDGRSAGGNHQTEKDIVHAIRQANRAEQIPIFAMGVGFDANMDLLKDITDRTPGGVAENIIEDLEAGPQMRAVRLHLKDVVLKNVNFNYVGKEFRKNSLTKTRFKFFHSGSSVIVAGKYDPAFPPRVTITGQSADGHYEEIPDGEIFGAEKVCQGTATLCSEPRFRGECITLDESKPSLKDRGFSNRAVSIKITGECAWIVCDLNNFRGFNLTLLPGSYEGIPDMHRTISSLKKVPLRQLVARGHLTTADSDAGGDVTSNTVARLWAFQTVQNALEKEENNAWTNGQSKRRQTLVRAYQLAAQFGFLTPFTDMYLEPDNVEDRVEPEGEVIHNSLITYKDLNPIFFQRDDPDIERQWAALKACTAPIRCDGNFHYELYQEDEPTKYEKENLDLNLGKPNCTGSITVYTKPKLRGDSLTTEESLHQLYHREVSQRLRSLKSDGDCCWLLFDHRFFAGDVERICGSQVQEGRRKNIGSIKKIGSG